MRTVNQEEYAAKRIEILAVVQRLIYTKGYEKMTIQDIRRELDMSNGAFFHYFDSKLAVLEAFIEQIQEETEKPLLPIIRDPQLSAIEKLQSFFGNLERLRLAQKTSVVNLLRVWYADDNVIVRQKVDDAVLRQRAPLLAEIVRQGIRERVFTTPYPDQAGEIILSLLRSMSNSHAKLLLSLEHEHDEQQCIKNIVTTHAAYMDAIERVIGASTPSLYRVDAEAVKVWVTAYKR